MDGTNTGEVVDAPQPGKGSSIVEHLKATSYAKTYDTLMSVASSWSACSTCTSYRPAWSNAADDNAAPTYKLHGICASSTESVSLKSHLGAARRAQMLLVETQELPDGRCMEPPRKLVLSPSHVEDDDKTN
jgi:hypothetical protein